MVATTIGIDLAKNVFQIHAACVTNDNLLYYKDVPTPILL
jgi:hypothetical protein